MCFLLYDLIFSKLGIKKVYVENRSMFIKYDKDYFVVRKCVELSLIVKIKIKWWLGGGKVVGEMCKYGLFYM